MLQGFDFGKIPSVEELKKRLPWHESAKKAKLPAGRSSGYGQIGKNWLSKGTQGLTTTETLIAVVLRCWMSKERMVWVSLNTIARAAKCSRSTAVRNLKSLEVKKFIRLVEKRPYKSSVYYVVQ